MTTITERLNSAVAGTEFSTKAGIILVYVDTLDKDCSFPHLMYDRATQCYVSYADNGQICTGWKGYPAYQLTNEQDEMTINLNQEVQIMENQIEVELNNFYLRNDGKVVEILEKLTPYRLSAKDGAEYISSLIFFGSDEYYYAKNGKAYTNEVMEEFETFLVAKIEFTYLDVPTDALEEAQDKLCSK